MIARIAIVAAAMLAVSIQAKADDRPLKIGWLMSYTGPGAAAGAASDAAIQVFFRKFGTTVAGRRIEIIKRDTTGPAPDVARRLAQELIVSENVDFLAGMDYTPNTMAVAPLSTSAKVPLLIVNSATSGILAKHPFAVRFGFTTTEMAQQLALYAAKQKLKSVYTFVHEYEPGLDAEAMFVREYKAAGGVIAGSVRAPLKATDFSAYIQRIKDANPDGIFVFMAAGELTPIFLRQFKEAGLDPAKIIGIGDITDESSLPAAGEAALGVVTAFHYTPTHDSEVNREFAAAFNAVAQGRPLGFIPVVSYDVLRAIYTVVDAQKGDLNPERTIELLKQTRFESPRGPIAIDPSTREIVQNIYFRRVENRDGQMVNLEFATIPDVKDPGSAR
ncbi:MULTISPECIES: ABC transporter substrate-binding protein [Bradyrhizobium]|uniref:ABC transporter substrate-binding protein n=3 Tax=Bradyrhizobium TaxID=374 RepID=A0A410VIG5_9BRAD|nr:MULTISPECIES: ABC transporter substrate-binding protein [Bradyrhizobium]MCG2628209.1 ABC transporter substrate-binding protein [Bradyrhizobium zhengyangense]MCG2643328.1 ABC transporter substrate-binding protein [Bradyrhizobium zhengyangense]MCG2670358.1 ABC transporter substrate-binding protein [Bradyrhizobium zhengyangense]MDN4985907.1 ABC transporter substrate-binding protein [Bradyrhizobium sp. WYCCWR 13022]MDN5002714.1 ABC transporter substrate-binding protein [Bradyrhizobium sp. WYCCW